ncbi:MAG: aldo/keto reductase [Spirochaetales bacterium]|nr:aldo/keto reductase [Spirochaetales bacterium]
MKYNRCGQSGLFLPELSYGIWHAFSENSDIENSKQLIRTAVDLGMLHIDTANVYGPPNGYAETRLGKILAEDFSTMRDQLLISTKAGYGMHEGPYGRGGSRKHIINQAEQSLRRLQMDYVDIFYLHGPDDTTPVEETAQALADLVRMGKTLYIGISNHNSAQTIQMTQALHQAGVPLLIHQVENSMLVPDKAADALPCLSESGAGAIVFAPLAGGRLSPKYLNGIPSTSRAASEIYLKQKDITREMIETVRQLNQLALDHGRTLPQLAILWASQHPTICSTLIGASRPEQLITNCKGLEQSPLSAEEHIDIQKILTAYHGDNLNRFMRSLA